MRNIAKCIEFSIQEADELIRQISIEYHFLKHLRKSTDNLGTIMSSINKIDTYRDILKICGQKEHLDIAKELQREYILSCIKDFENILHK